MARTRSWWYSKSGKEVEKRLRAWCDLQAHDYGYTFPSNGQGNAKLGKPGDLPVVTSLALDVELTIREWGLGKVEKMIAHVYGVGGHAYTVEDARVDLVINGFYPADDKNWKAWERAKERFVTATLLQFGQFMAERRGL